MEVRKLSDVLESQVGKIIDFIIKGFLLMLRLRNNGMATVILSSCTDHISKNDFLLNYINLSPAMA